jgi:hypothetical protein
MLLIKDLSARLPYAVTVEHTSGFRGILHDITIHHMYDDNDNVHNAICYTDFFGDEGCIYIEYFKPYLFPLSSMTDEQKDEYHDNCNVGLNRWGDEVYYDCVESIEWLNAHHFDYRSLIEKGLAIDATGLNIY